MGLSCLAVPQSDAMLQSYNSIHSESKFLGHIVSPCPELPKSDAFLEQRYIPIHPAPKFRDSIGLRDRSQPLIAAKRKNPDSPCRSMMIREYSLIKLCQRVDTIIPPIAVFSLLDILVLLQLHVVVLLQEVFYPATEYNIEQP